MLSNQILQRTLSDISKIVNANCSVWTPQGKCLFHTGGKEEASSERMYHLIQEYGEQEEWEDRDISFFLISDDGEPVYIFAIQSNEEYRKISGRLAANQLTTLVCAYKDKVDKKHFFQNLLLDNLLVVDVHNQAKKLKIESEEERIVFLIEPKKQGENIVIETMKAIYATGTKDYVTSVDEGHIILIKAVQSTEGYKEMDQTARLIVETMITEALVDVRVAYGTVVSELKDVSKSYKEASMALDVGRIFYSDRNVLAYNSLGIGRLIHQLPMSLCEMFLKEVFDGRAVEQFDEETLSTVAKFFENNLNISETARQLYVHRNTLVYRLEKIQKTTGLDVRVFEDALTFKIALMVADHVKFLQLQQ